MSTKTMEAGTLDVQVLRYEGLPHMSYRSLAADDPIFRPLNRLTSELNEVGGPGVPHLTCLVLMRFVEVRSSATSSNDRTYQIIGGD